MVYLSATAHRCRITNHFRTRWLPPTASISFTYRVCAFAERLCFPLEEAGVGSRCGLDSDSLHVTPCSPWKGSCLRQVLTGKMKNKKIFLKSTRKHKNTSPFKALTLPFTSLWPQQASWSSPTPVRQELGSVILHSARSQDRGREPRSG